MSAPTAKKPGQSFIFSPQKRSWIWHLVPETPLLTAAYPGGCRGFTGPVPQPLLMKVSRENSCRSAFPSTRKIRSVPPVHGGEETAMPLPWAAPWEETAGDWGRQVCAVCGPASPLSGLPFLIATRDGLTTRYGETRIEGGTFERGSSASKASPCCIDRDSKLTHSGTGSGVWGKRR